MMAVSTVSFPNVALCKPDYFSTKPAEVDVAQPIFVLCKIELLKSNAVCGAGFQDAAKGSFDDFSLFGAFPGYSGQNCLSPSVR